MIVRIIVAQSGERFDANALRERVALLDDNINTIEPPIVVRRPYFCSGCPHNTSTKVPVGSRALSGVGCHYMAVDMDRQTTTYTQMGGEGASWIGTAPFTNTAHIFANLGEGTYFHSGMLAIRACIAAGPNITYKILFNDAVAMTGGQPVDGELTVPQLLSGKCAPKALLGSKLSRTIRTSMAPMRISHRVCG
jgi:indolepyruvate ferredoxin oxidoreductase